MLIFYILGAIFISLLIYALLSLTLIRKVDISHKLAHVGKFTNDGKFNEAFNMTVNKSEERKHYFRPIVDIDHKDLRHVIFANNINSAMLNGDGKLVFELNLMSDTDTYYYSIMDNYKIDEKQCLVENIIANNFPKLYKNNTEYYDFLNLRDIGFEYDGRILMDDIVALIFNGKNRELILVSNDTNQSSFYVRYKNKQEIIDIIKKTNLYNHIMQWGIPGFAGSKLTFINSENLKGGMEDA
jgi:hypothetical protein